MKNFIVILAIYLGGFCRGSEFNTAKVRPGEDAILLCRNVSSKQINMFWAKLGDSGNYSVIADVDSNGPKFRAGFSNERFEVSSNKSFVSLKIKRVKMADTGFYFCGFNVFGNGEIDVVQLNVEDNHSTDDDINDTCSKCESDIMWWISTVLGSLCGLFLMIIVGFALKVKKLQTAQNQEENEPQENLASADLNYAALDFQPKPRRSHRRPVVIAPNVIYAAAR